MIVNNYHPRAIDSTGVHGNIHFKISRSLNRLFTGRTELLERIQTLLSDDNNTVKKQNRFVITGLGGQGKSEICLKVANLMRNECYHFEKTLYNG